MPPTVAIRCFPDGLSSSRESDAFVAIDVIRATTTAVTAVAMGRRCYPVATRERADELKKSMSDALLVGEVNGLMPPGFDLTNSPAALSRRTDTRPIILLSSSGTQVMDRIRDSKNGFVACLRNFSATICALADEIWSVTLIGAGTRGQFREEDQLCAAWIAAGLLDRGYVPRDRSTEEIIRKWKRSEPRDFLISESVSYLRRTNQTRDLHFILSHIDDIECSFKIVGDRIVRE